MGLDMYVRSRATAPADPVDFETEKSDHPLFYWRKHPDLHGWMRQLYLQRGGSDPDFNLSPLALTAGDIDALERDVADQALPPTSGFFFGRSDAEHDQETEAFIALARAALREGRHLYYVAWW